MERQQHNNLWADKLLQVSIPDRGDAWMAMEAVLDRQMPGGWRDKRRWLLLILFLLLVIGVCNCPRGGRLFHGSSVVNPNERAIAPPTASEPHGPGTQPSAGRDSATGGSVIRGSATEDSSVGSTGSVVLTPGNRPGPYAGATRLPKRTDNPRSGDRTARNDKRPPALFGNTAVSDSSQKEPPVLSKDTSRKLPQPLPKDSSRKKSPPLPKDTIRKKPPAPPKDDNQKEKENGWMVGIGLNQFFPIGGQRGSTYNSNGLTGTLSDYLPVPMVRYYFNHRLYIQLEAQVNTPQPTKKNLVISSPQPDTSIQGGIFTQVESSASIQQLYYFNIPLSLHFALSDHLNIGTGLQFSHLSNAIGEFDSTTITNSMNGGGGANSTIAKAAVTKSFKDDSLFHTIRTNELRFLLDASYTYKHFIAGLRYNQALSRFINVQLPTGQTTQARNSSLQLYVRYILWDTRKPPLPPAGRGSGAIPVASGRTMLWRDTGHTSPPK